MTMRFGLASLALFLAAAAAQAAPRSLDDCEAIQAPHAYNECLASFGPMRGGGGGKYPAPAKEGGQGARRHGSSGAVSGAAVRRGPGGRIRMEFTPGRR
jgi:hypothetical protein